MLKPPWKGKMFIPEGKASFTSLWEGQARTMGWNGPGRSLIVVSLTYKQILPHQCPECWLLPHQCPECWLSIWFLQNFHKFSPGLTHTTFVLSICSAHSYNYLVIGLALKKGNLWNKTAWLKRNIDSQPANQRALPVVIIRGSRFCLVFGGLAVWEMMDVIKLDYQSQGWNSSHRRSSASAIFGCNLEVEWELVWFVLCDGWLGLGALPRVG